MRLMEAWTARLCTSETLHLRNIRYIEARANSIGDISEYGNNLFDYVLVTQDGKEFDDLRETIE